MQGKSRKELFFDFGVEMREFLKPMWAEKHALSGFKNPKSSDFKMCQFTSLFIEMVINSLGEAAFFKGGGTRFPDINDGGFKDSDGIWHTHFWVEVDEFIIDITAQQFGAEEVIVTSLDDPRYKANISGDELDEYSYNVEKTALDWFELYPA